MWFEERSWSINQMKMSSIIVEEWRDIWSHKAEFIFVGLSYLFATTNFLNLPRLIIENGGLTFMAVYGVALLIVILPIIVMEMSVGQLTGRGPVQALYNICPTFKGVGVSQIAFSLIVLAYMTRYLAWLFLYIFYFFWSIFDDRPGLPWLNCKSFPEFLTPGLLCYESASIHSVNLNNNLNNLQNLITTTSTTSANNSLFIETTSTFSTIAATIFENFSTTISSIDNINNITNKFFEHKNASTSLALSLTGMVQNDFKNTEIKNQLNTLQKESALNHFMRSLENPSSNIAEFGDFQLYFLISQGAVWLCVFFAISFGVKWLGKVIMVTFIGLFVLLLTLSGRCIFLTGAIEMFQKLFYNSTDWRKFADYMVWKTAIEQAILASGIGFGAFITIGSYNRKTNNLVRDSMILMFGHILITILHLVVVVSLLGYVNVSTELSPKELIEHGENQMWQLIVYISFLPYSKLFTAILLIFCALGLLNIFFLLSLSVLATLEDGLGERWTRCFPRFLLSIFIAIFGAALSAYFATQAGKHAYELTSGFVKYITLEVILTFELLAVGWFYCAHSLGKDLRTMLKSTCAWCFGYFLLIFIYLLPVVPIAIGVLNLLTYSFENYSIPVKSWAFSELLGLAIAVVPLLPIPIFALAMICSSCKYPSQATKFQRLRHAFRSPMHYELMKNTDVSHEIGGHSSGNLSPRYSAAAPGYVLLPQHQTPAPLAQPENYNLEANNAFLNGTNVSAKTASTTTTASAHTAQNNSRLGTVERQ